MSVNINRKRKASTVDASAAESPLRPSSRTISSSSAIIRETPVLPRTRANSKKKKYRTTASKSTSVDSLRFIQPEFRLSTVDAVVQTKFEGDYFRLLESVEQSMLMPDFEVQAFIRQSHIPNTGSSVMIFIIQCLRNHHQPGKTHISSQVWYNRIQAYREWQHQQRKTATTGRNDELLEPRYIPTEEQGQGQWKRIEPKEPRVRQGCLDVFIRNHFQDDPVAFLEYLSTAMQQPGFNPFHFAKKHCLQSSYRIVRSILSHLRGEPPSVSSVTLADKWLANIAAFQDAKCVPPRSSRPTVSASIFMAPSSFDLENDSPAEEHGSGLFKTPRTESLGDPYDCSTHGLGLVGTHEESQGDPYDTSLGNKEEVATASVADGIRVYSTEDSLMQLVQDSWLDIVGTVAVLVLCESHPQLALIVMATPGALWVAVALVYLLVRKNPYR